VPSPTRPERCQGKTFGSDQGDGTRHGVGVPSPSTTRGDAVQQIVDALGMVMLVEVGIILVLGLGWIIGLQCAAINRLSRRDDPPPVNSPLVPGLRDRQGRW
jgi:hypothetical protein